MPFTVLECILSLRHGGIEENASAYRVWGQQNGGSRISVLVLGCKVRTGCLEVSGNLKRLDDFKSRLEGVLAFLYQETNQGILDLLSAHKTRFQEGILG